MYRVRVEGRIAWTSTDDFYWSKRVCYPHYRYICMHAICCIRIHVSTGPCVNKFNRISRHCASFCCLIIYFRGEGTNITMFGKFFFLSPSWATLVSLANLSQGRDFECASVFTSILVIKRVSLPAFHSTRVTRKLNICISECSLCTN